MDKNIMLYLSLPIQTRPLLNEKMVLLVAGVCNQEWSEDLIAFIEHTCC